MMLPLIIVLVAINAATFVLFAWDKRQSRVRGQRVRESTLLWASLLGGSTGAALAMKLVRHKTRKRSFLVRYFAIVAFQVLALGALIFFSGRLPKLDVLALAHA